MITVGTNWANAVEILQETSKIKHFKLDFLHEGHRPRKNNLASNDKFILNTFENM